MPKPDIKRITCEHLVKLESAGNEPKEHVVIDIRDRLEFETGHIAGSVHVPKRELTNNLPNLVPDKDKRVVVILGPTEEDEIESVHERLLEIGYDQVEYLAGGIDRYCEIADVGLDDIVSEVTEEEAGSVGDGDSDIDPESGDNEPLY